MESYSEVLQKSLDNYKDKSGKKAIALKDRIESIEAFELLVRKVLTEGIRESGKELCQCENPHHASTTNGDVVCTICGKFYWHNSLERT